jgi:hypothetical protein
MTRQRRIRSSTSRHDLLMNCTSQQCTRLRNVLKYLDNVRRSIGRYKLPGMVSFSVDYFALLCLWCHVPQL